MTQVKLVVEQRETGDRTMTETHTVLTEITHGDDDHSVLLTGEFSHGWHNEGADADGNRGIRQFYCDLEIGLTIQPTIEGHLGRDISALVSDEFYTKCEEALTESFTNHLQEIR